MEILKEEDDLKYLIRLTFDDVIDIHYSLCERLKALNKSKVWDRQRKIKRVKNMINKLEILL